jgi:hypothetical protein
MTVRRSIDRLSAALTALEEVTRELALSIDDQPDDDEPVIVDTLRDHCAALLDEVQKTSILAGAVRQDVRNLARCHEHFNDVVRMMRADVVSPANAAEIAQLAAEGSGAWTRWSAVIQQGFARCEEAAHAVSAAIVDCWSEIIEHDGPRTEHSTLRKEIAHE